LVPAVAPVPSAGERGNSGLAGRPCGWHRVAEQASPRGPDNRSRGVDCAGRVHNLRGTPRLFLCLLHRGPLSNEGGILNSIVLPETNMATVWLLNSLSCSPHLPNLKCGKVWLATKYSQCYARTCKGKKNCSRRCVAHQTGAYRHAAAATQPGPHLNQNRMKLLSYASRPFLFRLPGAAAHRHRLTASFPIPPKSKQWSER
jgi:hypothetical protein